MVSKGISQRNELRRRATGVVTLAAASAAPTAFPVAEIVSTEAEFKTVVSDAAVTVICQPTKSTSTFYRLADPNDIQKYGPIMSEPDNAHHGGPTGDTGDYHSQDVQQMAHRCAVKALAG